MMSYEKPLSDEQAETLTATARELIATEDSLLHQRFTWLIQIQGLLFAALGFAWKGAPLGLIIILAVVGVVVSVSISKALLWHGPAVTELYEWWQSKLTEEQRRTRRVIGRWNPSEPDSIDRWTRPWRAMPIVFDVAWAGVILVRLCS